AFMVQVPCGVPCGVPCAWAADAHTDAHMPTAAQTHASVITLRARSLIVHSRSFRIQGASRLMHLAANHFSENSRAVRRLGDVQPSRAMRSTCGFIPIPSTRATRRAG